MNDRQTSGLILVVITAFLLWLQNTGKLPFIVSTITGSAGVIPSANGVQQGTVSPMPVQPGSYTGGAVNPGLINYVLPTAQVPTATGGQQQPGQQQQSGGGGGGVSNVLGTIASVIPGGGVVGGIIKGIGSLFHF